MLASIRKKGSVIIVLFVLALIMIEATSAQTILPSSWSLEPSMPTARGGLSIVTVDGKIFAIGGATNNTAEGLLLNTTEEYDTTTKTWSEKAPMPTPRRDFATAVYQDKIYCIGGVYGQTSNYPILGMNLVVGSLANEIYDPSTDSWSIAAPLPFREYGNISATVVGDKIYIIDSGIKEPSLIYYPSNNTWEQSTDSQISFSWNSVVMRNINSTSQRSNQFMSVSLGSDIYMAAIGNKALFKFDTLTENWTLCTPAPFDINEGGSSVMLINSASGRIFFLGSNTSLVYNIVTDDWQTFPIMTTNRVGFGATTTNNEVYAIGGYAYDSTADSFLEGSTSNERFSLPVGISIIAPQQQEYSQNNIPLTFTVNGPYSRAEYSIDGKNNVSLEGNITLIGLPNGVHTVTICITDDHGGVLSAETTSFTVETTEVPWAIITTSLLAVIICTSLAWLFVKRKTGK